MIAAETGAAEERAALDGDDISDKEDDQEMSFDYSDCDNNDEYASEYEYEYHDLDTDEEQGEGGKSRKDDVGGRLKTKESIEETNFKKALAAMDGSNNNSCLVSPFCRAVGGDGIAHYVSPKICNICGKESHIPLSSCTVAAQWMQRGEDEGGGFMMLPRTLLPSVLTRRIKECSTMFDIPEEVAEKYFTLFNWNFERLKQNIPIPISKRLKVSESTTKNGSEMNSNDEHPPKKEGVKALKAVEDKKITASDSLSDQGSKENPINQELNNSANQGSDPKDITLNHVITLIQKILIFAKCHLKNSVQKNVTSNHAIQLIQKVENVAKSHLMMSVNAANMIYLAKQFVEMQAALKVKTKVSIRNFHTSDQYLEDIRLNGLDPSGLKQNNTYKGGVSLMMAVLPVYRSRFYIPLVVFPTKLKNSQKIRLCKNQYEKLFEDIFDKEDDEEKKIAAQRMCDTCCTGRENEAFHLFEDIYDKEDDEEKKIAAQRMCDICCTERENEAFHEMPCGHSYCRACWNSYFHAEFERHFGGATLRISCIDRNCQQMITLQHLQEVAPELLPRYEQQRLQSFVSGNHSTLRWCPGPECSKVAVRLKENMFLQPNNNVFCRDGCQTRFCFLCGEAPHDGPCLNPERIENTAKIKVGVFKSGIRQPCPGCKTPIEKNGGCNHMRCKCGMSFCWVCRADITLDPYRHNCERYRSMRERERERKNSVNIDVDFFIDTIQETNNYDHKSILTEILDEVGEKDKFAHYYNRFVTHGQGQCFAGEQCSIQAQANDYSTASGIKTATDTDFLFTANECLVQC